MTGRQLPLQRKLQGGRTQDALLQLLSAHQTHWMEQVVLPLCAGLFSAALVFLSIQFTADFAPRVQVPGWVVPFGAAAAVESVYITRMHRRARAPVSLRVVEFIALVLVCWWLLGWGRSQSVPLLPALKDLRQPDVFIPLALIGFCWLSGMQFGSQFLYIGTLADVAGDQTAAMLSFEDEALFSQHRTDRGRMSALLFCTRKLLFYLFLAAAFSAVVWEAGAQISPARWQAVLWGTVLLFVSGLVLQGLLYFYRLQTIWREAGIRVSSGLSRQWLSSLVLYAAAAACAALLLPAGISPLRFDSTVMWLGQVMESFWRINPTRTQTGSFESSPAGEMGAMPPGEAGLLLAVLQLVIILFTVLLAAGTGLVLVGMLILSFVKGEWERLPGILRLPVLAWLWVKAVVGRITGQLRRLHRRRLQFGARPGGRAFRGSRGLARKRRLREPAGTAAYIRHLFVRLVREAGESGIPFRRGQTAREYGDSLRKALDGELPDVDRLIGLYQEARYSPHPLPGSARDSARCAWRAVVGLLKGRSADGDLTKERTSD